MEKERTHLRMNKETENDNTNNARQRTIKKHRNITNTRHTDEYNTTQITINIHIRRSINIAKTEQT